MNASPAVRAGGSAAGAGPVAVGRAPLMAGAEDWPADVPEDVPEDAAEDGFYERFAAELEVLAELGGGRCCGVGTAGGVGKVLRARPAAGPLR